MTNVGRQARGQLSLSFVVPFVPGHRYYGAAPAATVSAPAGWTGGTRMGSGPWTYTYLANTQIPVAANPECDNPATGANTPDFAITFIALSDAGSGATSQQSITANASASSGDGTASDDA